MLGFKRLKHDAVTISGIELVQKSQKHQFKTGKLGGRSATMPETLECCTGRLIRNVEQSEGAQPFTNFAPEPASADAGAEELRTATVVISGIELAEKIKKGQFKIGQLGGCTATMPEIWQAALAA